MKKKKKGKEEKYQFLVRWSVIINYIYTGALRLFAFRQRCRNLNENPIETLVNLQMTL